MTRVQAALCIALVFYYSGLIAKALGAIAAEESIVKKLTAVCGKDGIKVSVRFSSPFKGVVYSDGHYDTPKCVFIDQEKKEKLTKLTETRFSFLIPAEDCGTKFHDPGSAISSQTDNATAQPVNELANEVYMENTVMFQQNHFIQEQGDLAQTLRCVWQKEIRRPLTAHLPLSFVGKQRQKYTPESKEEEKGKGNYVTLSLSTSSPPLLSFSPKQLPRNSTKQFSYLTSSQQRHAEIRKRFPAKGQVESVTYTGNSRRSGKSYPFRAPATAAEQWKSNYDMILYRGPSNFTALPLRSDDTSGTAKVALFSAVSLCPKLLFALTLISCHTFFSSTDPRW